MRNGSLSGLDLLKGTLWSLMPPEAMLVSVVHSAALGYDKAQDPRGCTWSVLALGGHVDVSGLCSHLRTC